MPAVVVPAVIAAGVLIPLQAGAVTDLPDKTADEVLALVSESSVSAFSGKLEQSSALGLPDLGALSGASSGSMPGPRSSADNAAAEGTAQATDGVDFASTALGLLTGSHTSRIFVDGPENTRVQIQDSLDERNFVRSGDDLWYYDSATNSATHATIPAGSADAAHAEVDAARIPGDAPTPAELADRFLTGIDASTAVTVGTDTDVAGRGTYELLLTPRTDGTLVQSVSIFVDAETGFPLGVTVLADGQEEAAFQVAYSEITFAAPDASLFAFTPPADATVTEQALPSYDELKQQAAEKAAARGITPESVAAAPAEATEEDLTDTLPFTLIGDGWGAIAELPAGSVPAELTENPMFAQITSAVDGGQAFSTTLANVLLTDDGRVFAGSVPLSALQDAAAAAPATE